MRYGMMNSPLTELDSEIAAVSGLGFDYLELTMDAPHADHLSVLANKAKVLAQLQRHGLGLICHMPTFVYLADLTEAIREASMRETMASLAAAREMACEKVVLHPWFVSGLGPLMAKTAREYGRKSLERLLDYGDELGITICLENLFPRAQSLVRPTDFATWLDSYPNLQLTLDTGHANLAGGSRTILSFIEKFGDRIGHVHVSDNRGQHDDHLPIGAGNIDFPTVIGALRATGYDRTVTFEVFTADREFVRQCRKKFRELWG